MDDELTRRAFVGVTLSGGAVVAATDLAAQTLTAPASAAQADPVHFTLKINGQPHTVTLEPRVTLLDALRERLQLTGTKKGCDHGQCGACTVLINGRRANSCLTLAIMHEGDEITTIEGLASEGKLHPMQAAFVENDGMQCGYCTPGQICSAVAMLTEFSHGSVSAVTPDVRHAPTELSSDEIRERLSGNICRCGAYPNIVRAVRAVYSTGGRA